MNKRDGNGARKAWYGPTGRERGTGSFGTGPGDGVLPRPCRVGDSPVVSTYVRGSSGRREKRINFTLFSQCQTSERIQGRGRGTL